MKKILLLIILFSFIMTTIFSQENSYIQSGSIGTVDEIEENENPLFDYKSIDEWIGDEFIFLPTKKSWQKYAYQSFKSSLSYEKYVGKIIKVTSIDNKSLPKVQFKVNDTGEVITATAYSDQIDGIARLSDINEARKNWMNSTLWYKREKLFTYNENTDSLGEFKIKKYSPVKIINIVLGWDADAPVRFIAETEDGNIGFISINLSGTNTPKILRNLSTFDDYFLSEDPRLKYNWPEDIWKYIEEGKVIIGMNRNQAKMSWGEPKKINKTTNGTVTREQWVYISNNYLYFNNGSLTSIQN